MRLKCIDIQGFKSFPDKINISFDRGITAIVGPNGSGKSNISDAIRWVLGEQSNKNLRSTKMEDVIFSGTTNRKPQSFAEVSLTIDNTNRALDIDYNEVMVTRRYYRSGESEYFINKSPVRLRDINELFMDTGIGRDGYSLIGQGTIDQILLGKTEDRRSMLEEVAGISKFRYRKTEAERKLASTEENLVRLKDIVSELEERIPSLEQQAGKARKYLALYEEKKDLEISLWVAELASIQENAKKIEDDYANARGQLEGLSVEADNIEKEINHLFEDNVRINARIADIQQPQLTWSDTLAELGSQKAVEQSRVEFERGVIEKIRDELSNVACRGDETKTQIEGIEKEIAEKSGEIEAINQKIAAAYDKISEIYAKGQDHEPVPQNRRKTEALSESVLHNQRERNELQMELVSLRSNIDIQEKRKEELVALCDSQDRQIEAVAQEVAGIENLIRDTSEEKSNEKNSADGLDKMFGIKSRAYEQALEKEQKCRREIDSLEQRRHILSEMEKHLEGFGGAVKAVLEQSRHGALKGIHGTVSQLIKVDEKYVTAIETALGAAIQNVVAEDQTAAKNAILWLKSKNAGRATFLPLDNLSLNPITERIEHKAGYIGHADQLVQADKGVQSAITYLLGRTLVCDQIDHAISLAKSLHNRYKVVTLDGQVIHAGGSMTGGSAAKSAGLLSRGIELEKIESELDLKNKEFANASSALEKASREKNALEGQIHSFAESIQRLEEEETRLRGLLENKTIVLTSYRQLLQGQKQELDSLNTVIAEEGARINSLEEKEAGLLEQEHTLQEEMVSLKGLTDVDKAETDALHTEISSFEVRKIGYLKEIEGQRSMIGQLQGVLEQFGSETSEKERQIEFSEKNIEDAIAFADKIAQQEQQIREKQAESDAQIQTLSAQRQEQEQLQTSYRTQQKEKNSAKEKMIGEVSRLEGKINGISAQTDQIVSQLLDVYELTVSEAREEAKQLENITEARKRVYTLKNGIKNLGNVNIDAIEEYDAVKSRYDFMNNQVNDLIESKAELEKIIRELLSRMKDIFAEKFELLNRAFQKIFSELFGGGTAQLVLSDPTDILNCEINVKAAPPGKIIKNLVSLSGGERAFTAICLYFAILQICPTPFCIMDEIEAALDDVNVTRFASYLRRYCNTTQFICITHRRGTMEEADVLYGVTMQEKGISQIINIDLDEAEKTILN